MLAGNRRSHPGRHSCDSSQTSRLQTACRSNELMSTHTATRVVWGDPDDSTTAGDSGLVGPARIAAVAIALGCRFACRGTAESDTSGRPRTEKFTIHKPQTKAGGHAQLQSDAWSGRGCCDAI